ncbi:Protein phosphatase 1 regulatory subunit 21 [Choanephora cucurbitarum]|uniref:Protein phosphatase 1 regulatory subunit 21 n=1 Tax=Choanephora cucurbitarum TaxID=101091 RepID=A0A1C7NRQ5_9FUNG|nr:Protein phosphatase 1 regulatory subunit 21 [Choanephora cucurbitarum]
MSDGLLSRHTSLSAGAIPASAEELSQRYAKLFQQYSRLKAQHAVLKKAVIKEQASNVSLQGNIKEKEKELRKLQEQLDLLAFHNERLTKRIQAVQDNDQRGTHFSLLGGSIKKDLERSQQTLEEMQKDLQTKIDKNAELHSEKVELEEKIEQSRNQIHDLEKRVAELQDENASLQAEVKTSGNVDTLQTVSIDTVSTEKHDALLQEVNSLKEQIEAKTALLRAKEDEAKKSDEQLISEVQGLQAILLAKVGHLDQEKLSLESALPASEALNQMKEQAKQYLLSLDEKHIPKEMPSEIVEKLAISAKTYNEELDSLVKQLEDTKQELSKLKMEKDQQLFYEKEKDQEKQFEYEQKMKQQQDRIDSLLATMEANEKAESKAIHDLQALNDRLAEENNRLLKEIELEKTDKEKALQDLNEIKNLAAKKQTESFDKETQVETSNEENTAEAKEEKEEEKELSLNEKKAKPEEEEVFVYPQSIQESSKAEPEEEEEEVFVYRGMDALPEEPKEEQKEISAKIYDENDMQQREEKLRLFYEKQLSQLNEKLQLVDGRAIRLNSLYLSSKEKLAAEEKEKHTIAEEVKQLTDQVKKLEDDLSSSKSDFQKYADSMTEYIATLQQSNN